MAEPLIVKGEDGVFRMAQCDADGVLAIRDAPGSIKAISGSTHVNPGTATEVAFGDTSAVVYIENTHATGALSVSLDGGTTYFDLAPGDAAEDRVARTSLHVKSAATASVTYVGKVSIP
jgi:hypothetical protein